MAIQQPSRINRFTRVRSTRLMTPVREVLEENRYSLFSTAAVNAPIVSTALRGAVRSQREAVDLTQEAAASRADMPTRRLSAIETGTREPTFFDFLKICEATGVDPRVLFNKVLDDMNYPVGYIPVRNSQPAMG